MSTSIALIAAVPVLDYALKRAVRRRPRSPLLRLGKFGKVQPVAGRLWLTRVGGRFGTGMMWILWSVGGAALMLVGAQMPSFQAPVTLILAGSLSNALEAAFSGGIVTDYVCLRFWPAFNLGDLSLTVGAIASVTQAVLMIGGRT